MSTRKPRQTGFTLLELLIAISIFAILSVIAYGGLKSILDTRQHTEILLNEMAQLQMGLTRLKRDVEQTVQRPVRDEYGDRLPAFRGGGDYSEYLLEFTRGGRPNPRQVTRSSLQRIAYLLEDKTLYRLTWPTLDRARESQPQRSRLLDKIKSVEIRFYDDKFKPRNSWPASSLPGEPAAPPLPVAVEWIIEHESWGRIRRLFQIAETIPAAAPAGGTP